MAAGSVESELERALEALQERVEGMVAPLRRRAADELQLVESRQSRLQVRFKIQCNVVCRPALLLCMLLPYDSRFVYSLDELSLAELWQS